MVANSRANVSAVIDPLDVSSALTFGFRLETRRVLTALPLIDRPNTVPLLAWRQRALNWRAYLLRNHVDSARQGYTTAFSMASYRDSLIVDHVHSRVMTCIHYRRPRRPVNFVCWILRSPSLRVFNVQSLNQR